VPDPNADVVLARLGDETLTGCDVLVAWHRATRVGLRDDDPRRLFARSLRDALFAAEARRLGLSPPGGTDLEIDRVLAEALLRQEALDALPRPIGRPATPEANATHATGATSASWVRARALVFSSRAAAVSAITALSAGGDFAALLPRSIDPNARRDQGDLGMVPPEGSAQVSAAVARAAHGLAAPGDVHPVPLEIVRMVTVTVRRRPRQRRVSGWWVVQLTDRPDPAGAMQATGTGVRRDRDRYLHLRAAARLRWAETLAPRVRAAIDAEGLQQVRVRASGE